MQHKVVENPVLYPEVKDLKKSIKVLDTPTNLEWLLSHFRAEIRYNTMSRRREINIPGHYIFLDDEANYSLSHVEHLAIINDMPERNINKHLDTIAGKNHYHPIANCLSSNKWDGVARWDNFLDTIKSTNPELDRVILKTWMVAAVAAAFNHTGFTNHGVLVLQGKQGIGKTEWVKSLEPTPCSSIKTGMLLDLKNKDSVILANRFWIVELGELDATFNKTDIAHLKSYITSAADDIRLPYGRCETRLYRRSVYVATVNEARFLIDTTGNRRWWTISVESINYHHQMDMKQVWAEVYESWKRGALTYLPDEIQYLVNESNIDHEKIDPLRERLLSFYIWDSDFRRSLTATEILIEMGVKNPTRAEATRLGILLTEINGKLGKRHPHGVRHDIPHPCHFRPNN